MKVNADELLFLRSRLFNLLFIPKIDTQVFRTKGVRVGYHYDECTNIESYRQKIECYLSSLELIASTENGQRREKAQVLLDAYKQASIGFYVKGFFKF